MVKIIQLGKTGGESGIRTHGPNEGITGFQDQLLKPLGHLSINGSLSDASVMIPQFREPVNTFISFPGVNFA